MQISYQQKAPAFANIDNIKEKFEKHYGRIFEDPIEFSKMLKEEENFQPQGLKLQELDLIDGRKCTMYKVSLEEESFHEQSFYL